ncbi:TPR domain-containing protein [Colletotrichum tofieldiae]|nr:TPR domain-containing protein [Colletotrichum tofieldiae]
MSTQHAQTATVPAAAHYYDLGPFRRLVSTKSHDAQTWFNRGLVWAYSFNHEEAARCFEQVIAHDPSCAMGYWGAAFASGPNYNKKWAAFDEKDLEETLAKCHSMAQKAKEHAATASPVEQALVYAIQHRFPTRSKPDDFSPSILAFANAMRQVYEEFGQTDLDIVALVADALMNTDPWNLFEKNSGQPNLSTPVLEIKDILERGLKTPDSRCHPGILHMYIHLMEMSKTPEAALVPADHLRGLVPDAGHMHHMPSHIDVLVGITAELSIRI